MNTDKDRTVTLGAFLRSCGLNPITINERTAQHLVYIAKLYAFPPFIDYEFHWNGDDGFRELWPCSKTLHDDFERLPRAKGDEPVALLLRSFRLSETLMARLKLFLPLLDTAASGVPCSLDHWVTLLARLNFCVERRGDLVDQAIDILYNEYRGEIDPYFPDQIAAAVKALEGRNLLQRYGVMINRKKRA